MKHDRRAAHNPKGIGSNRRLEIDRITLFLLRVPAAFSQAAKP